MPELQNFTQENNLPVSMPEEKIFDESKSGDLAIFSKEEFRYFTDEINKQFSETGAVDFRKATNNARYLAMLDKGFEEIKNGGGVFFTADEWEKFADGQEIL